MISSRPALTVVSLLIAAAAASVGVLYGIRYERDWECCRVPTSRRIPLAAEQMLGLTSFESERGQDVWIAKTVFPTVTNGFFLDVGSGDGIESSNTYALERKGWTGICVDAFPRNMSSRTCRVFRAAVDSEAGRHVTFYQAGDLGGIGDYLNHGKNIAEQGTPVQLVTTTLGDILTAAHAPQYIHFMSLDIEGAELAALRGFPFDRYKLGALVVEHNDEEAKRAGIEQLMNAHGYERVHSWYADDFYLPISRRP